MNDRAEAVAHPKDRLLRGVDEALAEADEWLNRRREAADD